MITPSCETRATPFRAATIISAATRHEKNAAVSQMH
jgi:hypothetical protein